MKIQTFRDRLSSDPSFAFSFMVENNEEMIANNMRGLGYSIESADDIFDAINELIADKRYDLLENAMNVRVNTVGVDPAILGVVRQVATAMRQVASPAGRAKSGPFNDMDNDELDNVDSDANGNGSGPSPEEGSTAWDNLYGAIVSGFVSIWTATHTAPTNVTNVDTATDAALAAQQEAERNARYKRYALIGVVVVVAIVIAWYAWKKMKG